MSHSVKVHPAGPEGHRICIEYEVIAWSHEVQEQSVSYSIHLNDLIKVFVLI